MLVLPPPFAPTVKEEAGAMKSGDEFFIPSELANAAADPNRKRSIVVESIFMVGLSKHQEGQKRSSEIPIGTMLCNGDFLCIREESPRHHGLEDN
mmetsp:Transcript_44707/g.93803  ORF Transcript_44707/g.93803 Transcript_44707/m.93803 type:complete len:95 (+) Transcript_44707:178-462(+)